MKSRVRGFGLVEIMVALVLGLVISAGIIQVFIAARGTFASQGSAARMQEDARFVLSKMVQELRMTGMYGCLGTDSYTLAPTAPEISRTTTVALNNPILWDSTTSTLTLVTADIGTTGTAPTWTILSNCQTASQLFAGARAPAAGQTAFPLRQLFYSFANNTLSVRSQLNATPQPLLTNVVNFQITFGLAGSPMTYVDNFAVANAAEIRSVRIALTLRDPDGRVRDQAYSVVAYLRNRL